jgi:uncharacterized protein (TIGR02246 family)
MRILLPAALMLAPIVAAPVTAAEGHPDYRGAAAVLANYKAALEKRDISSVDRLFAPDAQIFENGGVEGNFARYRDHHLGPELKAFQSFVLGNYKVAVRGEGDIALATETYSYTITLANGERIVRDGVATSVLKWADGAWRIVSLHSSSRKPKA